MRTIGTSNRNEMGRRMGRVLCGLLGIGFGGCGPANDNAGAEEPARLSEAAYTVAIIPSLSCPLSSCKVGGYKFDEPWGFASCGGKPKRHTGVDLTAAPGTSVTAPEDGQVLLIYSAGGCWGQAMLISHRDPWGATYLTQLMHITALKGMGAVVKRGETVAKVASLNPAMGCAPHLHFGVWSDAYKTPESWRGALPDPGAKTTGCGGELPSPASWKDPRDYAPIL